MKKKWITVRLDASEIEDIDAARNKLIESVGINISRSAFLRGIIMKSLERETTRMSVNAALGGGR